MSSSMNIVAHNLQGMFTDRQLGLVAGRKEKSAEKLSSGYRINRSADDAAGLAISEKMRRQIKGLTQGTANAQDGISMCQIADGALAEVHEMLNRITELSVQSANDTNNAEDRQAIQQEVGELLKEIDRVCDTTTFNEQPIFQGAEGVTVIPATYEPTKVDNFSASGTPAGNTAGTYTISANAGDFSINGESHGWSDFKDNSGHTLADAMIAAGTYSFTHNGIKMSVEAQAGASMDDVVGKLNGAGYTTKVASSTKTRLSDGIEISLGANGTLTGEGFASNSAPRLKYNKTSDYHQVILYTGLTDCDGNEITGTLNLVLSGSHAPANLDSKLCDIHNDFFMINKTWLGEFSGGAPGRGYTGHEGIGSFDILDASGYAPGTFTLRDAINLIDGCEVSRSIITDTVMGDGEIWRSFSGTSQRSAGSENEIIVKNDSIIDTDVTLALSMVFSPDYKGRELTPEQRISSDSDKQVYIQSGVEAGDGIYLVFGRMDTNILGIHGLDVTTQAGASDAIERAKGATVKLSDIRSEIGAQQNRLEHTIKHQKNTIENTQQAESLIRDTDMATEMMKYTADSVIQQAAQSMLTQANQSNQGVLSLLQ